MALRAPTIAGAPQRDQAGRIVVVEHLYAPILALALVVQLVGDGWSVLSEREATGSLADFWRGVALQGSLGVVQVSIAAVAGAPRGGSASGAYSV